ncbi:MAG: ergothioneine biosynthesis protein EgtB [Betaproteobacteria bacterium]
MTSTRHLHRVPSPAQTRDTPLVDRYDQVRAASLALAAPLSDEDCAIQSMPDASPVKWHLAHTSWFFETFVLAPNVAGYRAFDPAYRMLFNSYYNAVGEKHPRPQRGLLSRPSRAEVAAYRGHVDAAMRSLLQQREPLSPDVASLVVLGINHEQQHQELILTDVLHMLSHNPMLPAYCTHDGPGGASDDARPAPALAWIGFDPGLREIGHASEAFAFDNEMPRHRVYLEGFAVASRPVCNAEFLAFIADGGYRRPELWLSEGWDWVNVRGVDAPMYWQRDGGGWGQFTLRGMRMLDLAAPVCHVSLFEADAYARWAGARLPSEAEWETAAADIAIEGHFQEGGALVPRTVAGPARNDGALAQMYGDVWQWTQSPYSPYPGYRTAPGAVGEYNGKFMCNQFVLRGGSFATPRSHVRASYRNFFPAPARWQFSGFRLARDAA